MIKAFDGTINGKHVEKWEMTAEEKEAARARLEKLKNEKHGKGAPAGETPLS